MPVYLVAITQAARQENISAILEIGEHIWKSTGMRQTLAPLLLQIIAREGPEGQAFGSSNTRSQVVLAALESLCRSIPTLSDDNLRLMWTDLGYIILEQWNQVAAWIVFLSDSSVIEAYGEHGEGLQAVNAFGYNVFHSLWRMLSILYGVLTLPRSVHVTNTTPDCLYSIYRIWVALMNTLGDEATSRRCAVVNDALRQMTYTLGLSSGFDENEARMDLRIAALDFSLMPGLLIRFVHFHLKESDMPDPHLMTAAMAMLDIFANASFHPDWFSVQTRDGFVNILMRLARRYTLRLPLTHHEKSSTNSKLHQFLPLAIDSIGKIIAIILTTYPQYLDITVSLITHALREGLLAVARRVWFLGRCPCQTGDCPWGTTYAHIQAAIVNGMDPHKTWTTLVGVINLGVRQGGQSFYTQYHRSLERMNRDVERCRTTAFQPAMPDEWHELVEKVMPQVIALRMRFKASPQRLLCQGPGVRPHAHPTTVTGKLQCEAVRCVQDLRRCGGCHRPFYCSRECQRQDWKGGHSATCAEDVEIDVRLRYSPLLTSIDDAWLSQASEKISAIYALVALD